MAWSQLREFEDDWHGILCSVTRLPMLLSKAIDDFLSSRGRWLSAATVKWYRSLLKAFDGAAPGELLADIDANLSVSISLSP